MSGSTHGVERRVDAKESLFEGGVRGKVVSESKCRRNVHLALMAAGARTSPRFQAGPSTARQPGG